MKYHPDKPTGDTEKFKEISEAFDILSNADKREIYDNYGLEVAQGNAPAGDAGNPFAGAEGRRTSIQFQYWRTRRIPFKYIFNADAFNIFSQMGGFGMGDDHGFTYSSSGAGGNPFGGAGFGGGMPGGFGGGRARQRPEPDMLFPCPYQLVWKICIKVLLRN